MAYEYTLADVYKIFQQAEDKVAQLIEFRDMKLPYNINWDRIIEINSGKGK
jgi:regulator of sigma D